jgi:glycosyltransferase involved in cell wall biosynthesis
VHTHGYQADVVVGRAAASAGLPTVSTVHGFTGGDFKNRLYEFLQLRAFRRMSAVIAVSLPLCDRLRGAGVPAGRLHLVRNAWSSPAPPLTRSEARTLLGLPAADPIVGWIGRLSPEKGPEVFVEALGRCRWRASVMGDGRSGPALRQQAASLGIGERIRWHGLVGAAGRLVTAFDILVLSSHTEGTPIVLFEAMEAGVPIVATAVGGVPDVLGSEEALLVAPGQPEALAAAIDAAMGDRAAAAHRAARARQRLHSEFASGPWLARHEALYRSLLPVTGSRA